MTTLGGHLHGVFHAAREYLTPVLTSSAFYEKGVLTPDEFVLAGDHLCRCAPTWKWATGDASKARPYLPPSKQFLVTERVPCYRRVQSLSRDVGEGDRLVSSHGADEVGVEEEAWVEPGVRPYTGGDSGEDGGVISAPHVHARPAPAAAVAVQVDDEDDEYADMAAVATASLLVRDEGVAHEACGADLLRVRSYDVTITYDNFYKTPRVYLRGYDEAGAPLSAPDMLQDVMQDYANKTATIDPHPHVTSIGPFISIHPCRHAQAMKRIIDAIASSDASTGAAAGATGDGAGIAPGLSVELYIFIFLKFIASMIPTIEYDYTMAVKV